MQLESVPSQVSYQDVVNLSAEEQPLFVLQKIFGHEAFRQGQKETIDNILAGNDNIALLPTGGGKSIIYSVAAIIQGGIHIVVEPLKSLMEEQVRSLRGKNVVSYFVNNSVTEAQKDEIINNITNPSTQYALLLTSPEQLQGVKLQNALDLLKKQRRLINCFVDEAHCVDLWSGSF